MSYQKPAPSIFFFYKQIPFLGKLVKRHYFIVGLDFPTSSFFTKKNTKIGPCFRFPVSKPDFGCIPIMKVQMRFQKHFLLIRHLNCNTSAKQKRHTILDSGYS